MLVSGDEENYQGDMDGEGIMSVLCFIDSKYSYLNLMPLFALLQGDYSPEFINLCEHQLSLVGSK